MTFEWDEEKNKTNKKKHGVSFEMAVRVFLDEKRIERLDLEHSTLVEERTSIIGRVSDFLIRAEGFIPRRLRRGMLILFVISTDRDGKKGIISARKAEPDEEAEYYENYDAR